MQLDTIRGWVFDLDGVIWAGRQLLPGAAEFVGALRHSGRQVLFLSNNSAATAEGLAQRLSGHGIAAAPTDLVFPIGAAGESLRERYGPLKVLAAGVPELGAGLREAGHQTVTDPLAAEAVVMGRMPDFTYDYLASICRAVDRGIPFLALNKDARLPMEGGTWLPGLGALVAAVVAATGREPEIVGKPSPLLFHTALERMGTGPGESAMIGDTPEADIAGALGVGMWTVLVGGAVSGPEPHLRAENLAALHALMAGTL